MLSLSVTLKIEWWSPKVDMPEILLTVTIHLNLKATGDILWKYGDTRCKMQYFHVKSCSDIEN